MSNYYFLGTRFPPLTLGTAPEITFSELVTLMKDNLTPKDYAKSRIIRRYYDILNIRAYWLNEELDPYGNLDRDELEEALLIQACFPNYIYAFLEQYEKKEQRLLHFPELLSAYFKIESERAEGFLKNYILFEREWRLVLVGFRAKKLGRDLLKEMQFEDLNDVMVHQIIAQKDSKSYEPPDKYSDLKVIFEKLQNEPLALHLALSEYRFNEIEQLLGFDQFSGDRILGYMVELIIVEKWQALDKQKGIAIIDSIVTDSSLNIKS